MGCTEPIALAYCAATARAALGTLPEKITVEASGNIIKNVKSVVVPNTGGRRGIAAAAGIGVLGGDENAKLEVISNWKSSRVSARRRRSVWEPISKRRRSKSCRWSRITYLI